MKGMEAFHHIVFNIIKIIVETYPADVCFNMDDLLPVEFCPDEELREKYCYNTVEWLKANSYIYLIAEEFGPELSWERVVPTEKMLQLMNVNLPTLKNRSIYNALLDIIKGSAQGAFQSMVQEGIIDALGRSSNL